MIKEIGGDFNINFESFEYIERRFEKYFNLDLRSFQLLDSGRTALYIALKEVIKKIQRKPIIFIPNYLCESVVQPIKQLQVDIEYYDVFKNQKFHFPKIEELPDDSILLRICYFGFPKLPVLDLKNRTKVYVIDDLSHNPFLILKNNMEADYTIASLRKFFPIPDGGILISKNERDGVNLEVDPFWSNFKAGGMILKNAYLKNPSPELKRIFLPLLRESESILDKSLLNEIAISNLSLTILNSIDFDKIKTKRRENFNKLLTELPKLGITYMDFSEEIDFVPLGFPVFVKMRDDVKNQLIKHDIFPPVHWDLKDIVPKKYKDPHKVSNKILTIPIDQRYDLEDMDRIVKVLKKIVTS